MKRFVWLAALLGGAAVWGAVSTPNVGMVRCRDGGVYGLRGLHANLIVGARAFSLAQAASFSSQGGLVATDGRLLFIGANGVIQSSYFEGEASPVVNIDSDASSAIAWLPRRSELLTWTGSQFVPTPVALGGFVDSVRMAAPNSAQLLVTEADSSVVSVTVSLPDGGVTNISGIPGATGSAFYQQSFLLFHDANGLEVQESNGSMRALPITQSDLTFERIGADWVHIASTSAQRDWVLHLNSTVLELSELPQPPAKSPQSRPAPMPMPVHPFGKSMPRTAGSTE